MWRSWALSPRICAWYCLHTIKIKLLNIHWITQSYLKEEEQRCNWNVLLSLFSIEDFRLERAERGHVSLLSIRQRQDEWSADRRKKIRLRARQRLRIKENSGGFAANIPSNANAVRTMLPNQLLQCYVNKVDENTK